MNGTVTGMEMNAMRTAFFKHRFQPSIPTAAILTLLIGLFLAGSAHAAGPYQVIEVLSGDTLRVEDSRAVLTVRLVGIDAPEIKRDDTAPGQPLSEESRRYLLQSVFQKTVEVFSFGYDIDGNVLGAVRIDGNDVGIEMVRAGFAEVDPVKAPPGFDLGALREVENEARREGRGIWSLGAGYVSPRKWRKQELPPLPLAPQAARKQSGGTEAASSDAAGTTRPDHSRPASDAETRTGADRKTVVHAIDVEIGDSGEKLRVSMDGFSPPRAFDVNGRQPRVVVDILNVLEWKGRNRIPVNGKLIRQVRTYLHQDSGKLRIVLDLELDPSKDYLIEQYYDAEKNMYWLEIKK